MRLGLIRYKKYWLGSTVCFFLASTALQSAELSDAYREIDDYWESGAFEIKCGKDESDRIFPRFVEIFKVEKRMLGPIRLFKKQGVDWSELNVFESSDAGLAFGRGPQQLTDKQIFKRAPLNAISVDHPDSYIETNLNWIITKWDGPRDKFFDTYSTNAEILTVRTIDLVEGNLTSLGSRINDSEDQILNSRFRLNWAPLKNLISTESEKIANQLAKLETIVESNPKDYLEYWDTRDLIPDLENWTWLLDDDPNYRKKEAKGLYPSLTSCLEYAKGVKLMNYKAYEKNCGWKDPAEFFLGEMKHVYTGDGFDGVFGRGSAEKLPSVLSRLSEIEAIRLRQVDMLIKNVLDVSDDISIRVDISKLNHRDKDNEELYFPSASKQCSLIR